MDNERREKIRAYLDIQYNFVKQKSHNIAKLFDQLIKELKELKMGTRCEMFRKTILDYIKHLDFLKTEVLDQIRMYYAALETTLSEYSVKNKRSNAK